MVFIYRHYSIRPGEKQRKAAGENALSYQHAVAVVDLVLDNLRGPAGEKPGARLHGKVLPADLDCFETLAGACAAKQRKTAFGGVVRAAFADNFRIEHDCVDGQRAAVVKKRNDAFADAYHVGGHANARFTVRAERVEQVARGLNIFFCCGLRLSGKEKRVVNKRSYHDVSIILLSISSSAGQKSYKGISRGVIQRISLCSSSFGTPPAIVA